ncbi:unnamed protein product [Owenia fusiformis]|uniref:Carbohydrate sulfotransferase n=1 Tax=Owenia fusiformis TaxID=6347 RepID=A0A8J1U558_OWEFU|nr:unnamed protein product [Owenia fusiformis]
MACYRSEWKCWKRVVLFSLIVTLVIQIVILSSITVFRDTLNISRHGPTAHQIDVKEKDELPSFGNKLGQTGRSIEAILQLRKQHVEEQCLKVKNEELIFNVSALDHIYVDTKNKFIYCYVPKVASTQWRDILLANFMGIDANYIRKKRIDWKYWYNSKKLKQLKLFPKYEIIKMLNSFFKFMMVRNPMERVLSVWNDKFMDSKNKFYRQRLGRDIVKLFRKNATSSEIERGFIRFDEFIKYIAMSKDPLDRDEHWSRYYDLCRPCDLYYDVIGTYETLNIDSDYILERIGILDKFRFPVIPSKAQSVLNQYTATLELQDQQKFYQIFKTDYDMFNYSMSFK